uniref:Si:ch211-210c8.6 n=1 Tax=Salmo trutta TaxID=8032 RepID=A0A673WYY9_SALTR
VEFTGPDKGSTIAKCAATDLRIQWTGWAISGALKTEKFYDLAGSGTFLLLYHLSHYWGGTRHLRQNVQTGLVTAWGVRLGTFLFMRIVKDGKDRRFNNVRDSPGTFFVYWNLSGCLTLLPILMLNSEQRDEPLGLRDYLGWGIWSFGFVTEAITDQQKWLFKGNPDNAVIGKYSHYKILYCSGLDSASSVMKGPQYATSVCLVPAASHQWGSDSAFQNYVKNTLANSQFLMLHTF